MGGNKIMEFININNYFFFSFLEMKHNIEEKKIVWFLIIILY